MMGIIVMTGTNSVVSGVRTLDCSYWNGRTSTRPWHAFEPSAASASA